MRCPGCEQLSSAGRDGRRRDAFVARVVGALELLSNGDDRFAPRPEALGPLISNVALFLVFAGSRTFGCVCVHICPHKTQKASGLPNSGRPELQIRSFNLSKVARRDQ